MSLPRTVEVVRRGENKYVVLAFSTNGVGELFRGNREQVHSWLGQNGYRQQNTVLQGAYAREGLGA